jgi:RNA polymerase sigma-70 factor (family 1)
MDQADHNQQLLLERIVNGDTIAFAALFDIYHPDIYLASLLATRSPELSEEIVQDVFLEMWMQKEKLLNIRDFRSYFFIVVRNRAYRALRKQVRMVELGEQYPEDIAGDTDQSDHEQLLSLVDKAIELLPPQQKQVFILSKKEGKKREEIASIMNISPETVKSYLSKAILFIRSWCAQNQRKLPAGLVFWLLFRNF